MISSVHALAVGNALVVRLSPPAGARLWRLLRKDTDTISGEADPSALVVFEGEDLSVLDHAFLKNGTPYFYRPFYMVDGAWVPGNSASGTPAANYEDQTQDVLDVLRDRIEAGLRIEVERKNLRPDAKFIQVVTAPPPIDHNLRLPLVSIHLDSDDPRDRAIGDDIGGIGMDPIADEWLDEGGWITAVSISVTGWSLNPDERKELRKALRRVIVANLAVFASHGFDEVNFSQRDEDMLSGEQGANLYLAACTFSCVAPVVVASRRRRESFSEIAIGSTNDVENPHGECGCSG